MPTLKSHVDVMWIHFYHNISNNIKRREIHVPGSRRRNSACLQFINNLLDVWRFKILLQTKPERKETLVNAGLIDYSIPYSIAQASTLLWWIQRKLKNKACFQIHWDVPNRGLQFFKWNRIIASMFLIGFVRLNRYRCSAACQSFCDSLSENVSNTKCM